MPTGIDMPSNPVSPALAHGSRAGKGKGKGKGKGVAGLPPASRRHRSDAEATQKRLGSQRLLSVSWPTRPPPTPVAYPHHTSRHVPRALSRSLAPPPARPSLHRVTPLFTGSLAAISAGQVVRVAPLSSLKVAHRQSGRNRSGRPSCRSLPLPTPLGRSTRTWRRSSSSPSSSSSSSSCAPAPLVSSRSLSRDVWADSDAVHGLTRMRFTG